MPTKHVGPIHLPTDLYDQLERLAVAEEPDPLQQARWLLRQTLQVKHCSFLPDIHPHDAGYPPGSGPLDQ